MNQDRINNDKFNFTISIYQIEQGSSTDFMSAGPWPGSHGHAI